MVETMVSINTWVDKVEIANMFELQKLSKKQIMNLVEKKKQEATKYMDALWLKHQLEEV